MASRSQEPPTTKTSAPKSRTSKTATPEVSTKTATAAKSKTSKTAAKEAESSSAAAAKTKTSKAPAAKAPSAVTSAPKARTIKATALEPTPSVAPVAKAATRKTTAESEVSTNAAEPNVALPDGLRLQWIAEAAYFIAERRGFSAGSVEDDWREAEREIDRMLAATRH